MPIKPWWTLWFSHMQRRIILEDLAIEIYHRNRRGRDSLFSILLLNFHSEKRKNRSFSTIQQSSETFPFYHQFVGRRFSFNRNAWLCDSIPTYTHSNDLISSNIPTVIACNHISFQSATRKRGKFSRFILAFRIIVFFFGIFISSSFHHCSISSPSERAPSIWISLQSFPRHFSLLPPPTESSDVEFMLHMREWVPGSLFNV